MDRMDAADRGRTERSVNLGRSWRRVRRTEGRWGVGGGCVVDVFDSGN